MKLKAAKMVILKKMKKAENKLLIAVKVSNIDKAYKRIKKLYKVLRNWSNKILKVRKAAK